MVLGYYPGDFGRTGSIYNSGGSHTADAENLSAPWPLYNGNISSWTSKNYVPASALACQPKATRTSGAKNLVTAEPTLPAPKMPSAVPCFSGGYQRET